MIDGGLRKLFREHLPEAQWTSIESPITGSGIPDAEACFPGGATCWVEFKLARGSRVKIDPFQVSWHDRRFRLGGLSFVAVRRVDDLLLYPGSCIKVLKSDGLRTVPLGVWTGGPGRWAWPEVRKLLEKKA